MKNNILRVQSDNFPEKPNSSQVTSVLSFGEDFRSVLFSYCGLCGLPAIHATPVS